MSRRMEYETGYRPHAERRSGGFFSKFIAALLGFLFGVLAVGGTVFGVGYYFYTRPVKTIVDKANGVIDKDIDITKYLTEEYYTKTVKDLIGSLEAPLQEIESKKGSFATLAKISPTVDTALDKVATKCVEYGSILTKEEIVESLRTTPFNALNKYLSETLISSFQMGVLLQKSGVMSYEKLTTDPTLMAVFFGVKGQDYTLDPTNKKILPVGDTVFLTVGQLKEDPKEIVYDIPLDTVMTDAKTTDKLALYLLYSKEGIHFEFVDEKPSEGSQPIEVPQTDESAQKAYKYAKLLQKQMTVHHDTTLEKAPWCLHNEYGEAVKVDKDSLMEIDGASQVTKQVGEATYYYTPRFRYAIDGVEYRLLEADAEKGTPVPKDIRLLDKLTIHEYAPAYYLQVNRGTIQSPAYEDLYYQPNTLGAIMKEGIINHFTKRITLLEVLDDAEVQTNIFLKHLSHTVIDELPNAINQLTIMEVFGEQFEYEKNANGAFVDTEGFALTQDETGAWVRSDGTVSKRVLTGTWKYLLTDADPSDDTENGGATPPEAFRVTEVDKLVNNMRGNMRIVTLGELVDDKIIEVDNPEEFKNKQFGGKALHEFTIKGLIDAIMALS